VSKFAEYDPDHRRGPRVADADGFAVRRTRADDLPHVARIVAEREEGDPAEHLARLVREFERREGPESALWVATLDGRVVGHARAVWFTPPAGSPSDVAPEGWYLAGVIVDPEFRGRGVGEALTRARLAWIDGRGGRTFYFASARNRVTIDLHAKLGFVEVTRQYTYPGASFTGGVGILFERGGIGMRVDIGSKTPKRFALARDAMFRPGDQAAIAVFVAQLDDQTRRLLRTVEGLTVADLEWQPRPGRNTAGMLLEHIAQTEVFWMAVAAGAATDRASGERATRDVLGLGLEDDGMPLAPGGRHPAALAGFDLARYVEILQRARRYLKTVASSWTDAELATCGVYEGDEFAREWTLYHLLEHYAQHAGQLGLVLALRRQTG
jgi:GNAT superfamily N-acetyltransferase